MPTRKDAEGRWHAEVCIGGKRLHRRLPAGAGASDAKRLESELSRALYAHKPTRTPSVPGDPLLTDLLADYTERHAERLRSPATAKFHAYRIAKWAEGKRASDARTVAAAIVRDLVPCYAVATVNRSLGTLKRALALAYADGRLQIDYSAMIKRLPENNQRTTHLSMEQVQHLASCASPNVRAAIWIALLTGCRRGEICKIAVADIGADTIRLPAGNTKTLRYREIPITPALRPWLPWLPLRISARGVESGFVNARIAAGMPHVKFHDLRHSCATLLLSLGVPLHVIRDVLGHTSIKVTERYAHSMVGPQRDALERLGELHRSITPTVASA